ncbi:MAG: sulfotransferase [Deltaproteobacteria bacterium]|nr:sulfotransferase [Deltaproteobacteria bacterium]
MELRAPRVTRARYLHELDVAVPPPAGAPALLRLLRQYEVDDRYRKRARAQLIFSAALEPFRWWERLRWGGRIRRTEIEQPPVYLLGFGRSGTTHLHNLLWQDPQFGVVTNYLANMYPVALTGQGWLQRYFANKIPSKRPMDNIAITLDAPQEEEIALMNATDQAPLHFMSFPRALPDIYDRYTAELGTDAGVLAAWKRSYLELLKKATILSGGRRLALKTPAHTGRVPVLLDVFPDARFVSIVRNPYRVYQSMRNMYRKILPRQVLQEFAWEDIDAWVVGAYEKVMSKYLEDRKRIPPGNLVEITYEDLDERPLELLPAIYETLGLGDFDAVRPRIEEYLHSLGTFEKNVFDFPADVVETVNEHWGFALEAYGYERLEPGQAPE